jgi:hypothetical protein
MAKENPYIIKLSKPYKFEDKEYTEIDLSGIENLSTGDLVRAERTWTAEGNAASVLQTNLAYTLHVAALATEKPIEFFYKLPQKDGLAIKNFLFQRFFSDME